MNSVALSTFNIAALTSAVQVSDTTMLNKQRLLVPENN
jgi:hypothetical protein